MMYKGAVAPKTALPYGRDSCIAWNRCHIFMNKRGTYGIIADDLRFDTQLSNVYGNAIRAKLAAAQTTRSVAGRSQVSRRKTCKASALYTIGIHAFFINLRNPIPLQIQESPPFATPDAKSCFSFPCLWQSKQILLKMRKKSPSQLRSLDRYCDGTF